MEIFLKTQFRISYANDLFGVTKKIIFHGHGWMLPSGYNPLQQLVLIIADGRFNEKEKLKRYVRDILSKKRMVAFILLDSPSESIMEFMEATVRGTDIKFTKYLDSFPFPYYVVLKNIEALPRTLGDLLRQWFELMQQYNRE